MTPTKHTLRKIASSPELVREQAPATVLENEENQWPYIVGNFIALRLRAALRPEQNHHIVKAEILKCFLPFTMSPVMLVRLDDPALELKGDFILKMYDRRFTSEFRRQCRDPSWSPELEYKYRRYVVGGEVASKLLRKMEGFRTLWPTEDDFDDDDGDEPWNDAENELYYQNVARRLYNTESEVYRRLKDLHGADVPRCVATVELLEYNISRYTFGSEASKFYDCPGLLLQYIKGFPLSELYDGEPGAPRETWQYICDDAIRIVNTISAYDICNDDTNVRNTVVSWDPFTEKYKVHMIDFGHCSFKQPDESDRDWRETRANADEEGAIGQIMQLKLEEERGGGFVYTRSEDSKQLKYDFMGGDGPRI